MRHSKQLLSRASFALLVAGALGSCKTRLVDFPDCVVAPKIQSVRTTCHETSITNKVDALFMVDNSGSMDAMQSELRNRFPEFLKVFHDLAAQGTYIDLHIGVVTSDYGAGATGNGGCAPSPGGQRGLLQAIGQFAAAGCKAPTDAPFIKYVFGPGGPGGSDTSNLPTGQDLDATFTCMASTGARGCGDEHQLESVYAALHNTNENAGFLRDDALLAILFLTNEDDCSAPASTDLFDGSKDAKYGYDGSLRCTRFGILCGDPGAQPPYGSSNGPMAMCVSEPNPGDAGPGKLFDIGRYIDYFARPAALGGVKFDPADVLLAALDAPEAPFEIIEADTSVSGQDGKPYKKCDAFSDPANCIPVLQHSCQNPLDGNFFGDPSVRLNAVVRSAQNSAVSSICESDYSTVLVNLGKLIISQLGACCLSERLPPDPRAPTDPSQFIAECTVEEVTQNLDGTTTVTEVPECAANVPTPCWKIETKDQCTGLSPQTLGVTIERGGLMAPPHTTARASCRQSG